ncbi:MAG: RluA family pseudouridine synthase [Rhodospirillaceae bacterium]|nr:RluA family pseudouridine synthase [Rhodospirillaceae bacterium]
MAVSQHTIADDEADLRLDRWFKRRFPALTHGRLEKLLRTGQVRVDGKRVKASDHVQAGQVVRVPPLALDDAPKRVPRPALRPGDLDALKGWILFQDRSVIVLNKPPGLAVQGGTKSERNLDAMLAAAAESLGGRPLLVHRLDRDTSGVLLLARSPDVARKLGEAFRGKEAKKLYWALIAGKPERPRGLVDLPLAKRTGSAGERVVALDYEEDLDLDEAGARRAVSAYAVIDNAGNRVSFVALQPRTGRTHQLRVHMAALGTPILGDGKYGGSGAFVRMDGIAAQLHLHARRLRLPHPERGTIDVKAPAPPHFLRTLDALGFGAPGSEADDFIDD